MAYELNKLRTLLQPRLITRGTITRMTSVDITVSTNQGQLLVPFLPGFTLGDTVNVQNGVIVKTSGKALTVYEV